MDPSLFRRSIRDWSDYWQSEARILASEAAKSLAFDLGHAIAGLSMLERLKSASREETISKTILRWHFNHPIAWFESATTDLYAITNVPPGTRLPARPPSSDNHYARALKDRASTDPFVNFLGSCTYIFGNDLRDGSVSGPSLLEDWDVIIKDLSDHALRNGPSDIEHTLPDTV